MPDRKHTATAAVPVRCAAAAAHNVQVGRGACRGGRTSVLRWAAAHPAIGQIKPDAAAAPPAAHAPAAGAHPGPHRAAAHAPAPAGGARAEPAACDMSPGTQSQDTSSYKAPTIR